MGSLFVSFLSAAPSFESSRNCADLPNMVRAGSSLEADFALEALAHCPPIADRTITSLLEETIESGDLQQRPRAFRALSEHLDVHSVPFLLRMYYAPELTRPEKELVVGYLCRLAEPRWKSPLRDIFREGISSASRQIRIDSVVGLGRIDAPEDWERYLAPFARTTDADLLSALLESARLLREERALELGIRHLYDSRSRIALGAMELLAVLSDVRARQALLLREYRAVTGDLPSPALAADPRGEPCITLDRTRLYVKPHDRSEIVVALAADSVVYLKERATRRYRPAAGGPENAWLFVETASGHAGWVHAGDVFVRVGAPEPKRAEPGAAVLPTEGPPVEPPRTNEHDEDPAVETAP